MIFTELKFYDIFPKDRKIKIRNIVNNIWNFWEGRMPQAQPEHCEIWKELQIFPIYTQPRTIMVWECKRSHAAGATW